MSLFDDASLVLIPDGAKDSKLYSVKPTDGAGDFTFSRSTTATRVNESGLIESVATNVPRIDYSEGGCPSLLLEPQRTNLLTYSEDFDNAAWTKQSVSVSADAAVSPDGTTTADLFYPASTGNFRAIRRSETSDCLSFFAKSAGFQWLRVRVNASMSDYVNFDVLNGIVGFTDSGITAEIEDFGNGWYRCSFTYTSLVNPYINLSDSDGSGSPTATVNGTDGVYIWGAQVEEGSYPTSYIPTNSAAVTRNADSCELTGASSLIGQTEGTILFKTDFSESTVIHVLGQNLTVTDEQVKIEYSSSQIKFYLNDSLVATKNGTFDFSGTDEIELGNYLGGSELGGHISNFVTV